MLFDAHKAGAAAALARFKVAAGAGVMGALRSYAEGGARAMLGHPEKILRANSYRPGGMLNWKNVLWPHVPGKPLQTWATRGLGTILPAYGVYQTLQGTQGDPSKGRAENVLGSIGDAAGFAFGFPAAGMVGAPFLSRAGRALGEGLGRVVDGPRRQQPPQQQQAPQQQAPQQGDPYASPGV